MFYSLLVRLNTYFEPAVINLKRIIKAEGKDYRKYSASSKKAVAAVASLAVSIKAVLDTPILTPDGNLTDVSQQLLESQKRNN